MNNENDECANKVHMCEHACTNPAQCWEPCGELGKAAQHTKVYVLPAEKRHADMLAESSTQDDRVQNALSKMAKAHARGTGCRLTADEIFALSVTTFGEIWGQPDPRKEIKK